MKLLLCLILLTCSAQAQQWRLVSTLKAEPLGPGAFHVVKQIAGPAKVEIRLVVFDEKQCELKVVANDDPRAAWKLDEIGQARKALAVCNGGYFNVSGNFGPVGLEIAEGTRSDKFIAGEWVGGLMVRQGKASLVWSNEFQDAPDISEFVQCSPWLVSAGRAWPVPPSKEPEPRNNRTFILTDGAGRWPSAPPSAPACWNSPRSSSLPASSPR